MEYSTVFDFFWSLAAKLTKWLMKFINESINIKAVGDNAYSRVFSGILQVIIQLHVLTRRAIGRRRAMTFQTLFITWNTLLHQLVSVVVTLAWFDTVLHIQLIICFAYITVPCQWSITTVTQGVTGSAFLHMCKHAHSHHFYTKSISY